MDDFQTALLKWKSEKRLILKEIGLMLKPPVSASVVGAWVSGDAEPKKGHRGQLVKLSKNIIKPRHFL